jgi:hypothetical protein
LANDETARGRKKQTLGTAERRGGADMAALILCALLAVAGCKDETVTITSSYVIGPSRRGFDSSIRIARMVPHGNLGSSDANAPSARDLLKKLVEDTAFIYTAYIKSNEEHLEEPRIYFDRPNDFVWRKPPELDSLRTTEFRTIGRLEAGNWYMIAGLSDMKTLYFVYIDSLDHPHPYEVPASAWTNN